VPAQGDAGGDHAGRVHDLRGLLAGRGGAGALPRLVRAHPRGGGRGLQMTIAPALLGWYDGARRGLPRRRDPSPYRPLVSEFMLQQTVVAAVAPFFERFCARFPDVHALAAAPEDEVVALWSGLGYYARARNLQAAARAVVARHGGQLPSTEEALRAL